MEKGRIHNRNLSRANQKGQDATLISHSRFVLPFSLGFTLPLA